FTPPGNPTPTLAQKSDSYHSLPLGPSAPVMPVWRLFHIPTFTVTLRTVPPPDLSATPRSAAGQRISPVSSCGMPRNRYAFEASIEPVRVIAPGFGSPLVCAATGPLSSSPVAHTMAATRQVRADPPIHASRAAQ